MQDPGPYWTLTPDQVQAALGSASTGLSSAEAERRLGEYGRNEVERRRVPTLRALLVAQLRNPLLALLVFAAIVSIASGEWVDAGIVVAIGQVALSLLLALAVSLALLRLLPEKTVGYGIRAGGALRVWQGIVENVG